MSTCIADLTHQWAALWDELGELDSRSANHDRRCRILFERIEGTEVLALTARATSPAEALWQLAMASKRTHDIAEHELRRTDIEKSCALIQAAIYSIRDVLLAATGVGAPDITASKFLPEYLNPHATNDKSA